MDMVEIHVGRLAAIASYTMELLELQSSRNGMNF